MSDRSRTNARPRTFAAAIGAMLICVALGSPKEARAQIQDPDFPVTDGPVTATAILGNTLYVGGSFNLIGGRTGSAAVLDTLSH